MKTDLTLALTDLEAFDPGARHGGEWRFCCPLSSCQGKTVSKTHRSISVNMQTGAWHCHRCGEGGVLREWQTRPAPAEFLSPRQRSRASARQAFQVNSPGLVPQPIPNTIPPPLSRQTTTQNWRNLLVGLQPIGGTQAETYLLGRGITPEIAHRAGARYADDWYGRPAVVFPIRDQADTLVAAQGRYLDSCANPKARTAGPCRAGVFVTKTALLRGDTVVITEAPIDALSIACSGYAAVALIGTHFPAWLPAACAFKRVFIATDNDDAGHLAAEKLAAALLPYGCKLQRLQPVHGKDWNELLQARGVDAFSKALTPILFPRVTLDLGEMK